MLLPKSIADEATKTLPLCSDCKPVKLGDISTGRVHLCHKHAATDLLLKAAEAALGVIEPNDNQKDSRTNRVIKQLEKAIRKSQR